MRVRCEVVGQALNLRGPQYAVGERLFLDPMDPTHREALTAGWVRRLDLDPTPAPQLPDETQTVALAAPPSNKMVIGAPNKQHILTRRGKP